MIFMMPIFNNVFIVESYKNTSVFQRQKNDDSDNLIRIHVNCRPSLCDYFASWKAPYRTLESTFSLHGKQQSATRKALKISCS